MDSFCSILRACLWRGCLLCVLSALVAGPALASTRKHVSMPTAQSVATNPSGPVTRTGNSLFVPGQPLEGEFIPGVDGKKIPVRGILPTIDFSIPRTLTAGKNLLKGGAIGVGVSLGIDWLLSQIDAIIDNGVVKVPSITEAQPGPGNYWWSNPFVLTDPTKFTSPDKSCRIRDGQQYSLPGSKWEFVSAQKVDDAKFACIYNSYNPDGSPALKNYIGGYTARNGTNCPSGATYDSARGACLMPNGYEPLSSQGYDTMFDIANQQNAAWLSNLMKDVCANSPSPARCFEELKQGSALSGPKTVPGETVTKTTNTTGSNGVVTQTVTNTKNTYNFTYGPTYYDYSKTTQITTSQDGVPVSDETITEPSEPEQEQEPQEEDKEEEPILCSGQGCDGPAYVDQYEPTDVTKESAIDSYMSRIQGIPIIAAVGGLFSVNVSGSCPVWEVNSSLEVLGASMPINLRFDYLCLPWVVSLKPWVQAVMFAVCLMLAIRIAIL